jgi:hypothetical protein
MDDDPIGVDGELVDRLISAVNSSHERDWLNIVWFLVFAVGGDDLDRLEPDSGREPSPGSVAAERRTRLQLVSRDAYFRHIRNRLMQLVQSGVREDFLVRALRDELTTNCQMLANTEAGNTKREELRDSLERRATDPEFIAVFRARLAAKDPSAALLTDDEVGARLRNMASMTEPMSKADEQEAWNRAARWNEQAEALSDRVIALWKERYAFRVTGS